MIRKITHIIIWLILGAWFTVIMGFVSNSNESLLCKEIRVNVSDSTAVRFVTATSVRQRISTSGINTQGYPLEEIRTRELEQLLEKDPYIRNAEVYSNVDGNLMVDVEQRRPLVRVMPGGREGYYLDHDHVVLPLSDSYSPMVLLLTGHVELPRVTGEQGLRRVDPGKDPEWNALLGFAEMVGQHPFWSKQIVQLYRSPDGDYELIPRVGAHQVILGSIEGYEKKLRNLELLYEQGLKKYGWNTYDKINLKYSNQIICTKR